MKSKKLFIQEEKIWRDIVANHVRGRIEVKTKVGVIDVLCYFPESIYEVKHISKWKHALGQILAYGYFYPSYAKYLYLFGASNADLRSLITDICNKYDVSVKFTDFPMAPYVKDVALSKAKRELGEIE